MPLASRGVQGAVSSPRRPEFDEQAPRESAGTCLTPSLLTSRLIHSAQQGQITSECDSSTLPLHQPSNVTVKGYVTCLSDEKAPSHHLFRKPRATVAD